MTGRWYALRSKPMRESLLWEQLRLRRIESFYPRIRTQPAGRSTATLKPYFPGYLFARMDLALIHRQVLLWLPGLAGIVSFGGPPPHVPDHIIEAIRRRVEAVNGHPTQALDMLKPGHLVTVQEGPFKGFEGVLDARISGQARVRVFLHLLNKTHIALELPGGQIQRTKR